MLSGEIFLYVVANFFFGNVAYSQVPLPGDADTSRLRPPRLPLPTTPKFDLRIESPEKSPVPKAVDDITFEVKAIDLEGAEYYAKNEIDEIFAPLIGKKISLDALRKATERLEKKYKDDDFFLVRVIIPPQEVENGVFKVKVIEGYINNVFGVHSAMPMTYLIFTPDETFLGNSMCFMCTNKNF